MMSVLYTLNMIAAVIIIVRMCIDVYSWNQTRISDIEFMKFLRAELDSKQEKNR